MQENGGINLIDWSGIPSTWKLGKLGDYCEIRRGASPRPAGDPRYFGGDIPWFKIGDATKNPGRFLTETAETVNVEGARRSVQIPAGSLIIANSGVSLGFAVFVGVTGCVHDGWLVLNNFKGIDDRYIFYCVNLLTNALRGMADGTTQPNLNTTIARNLVIPVPPIEEQRRIAKTLWSLDDKIELNRRMNATLEAMARALFKAWFVDFEPVHANKENRPSTSASPEIAKLFPSAFENGIPKGWHTKKISECCDVARGASPRPIHDFIGDDIPWVKIADATAAGSFFIFETKEKIKANGKEMSVFLKKGSLILSNSATCGIPMFLELDGCIHDGWLYFSNYRGISSDYLFEALARMTERLAGEADGTVQKNLNTGIISRQEVVVPTANVMAIFETVHMSLFEKIKGNTMENRKLSEIRDSLLPRLISGKLRANARTK